mmetsp:Transcript_37403/g.92517  ORF Transcript_37403/g.92517 Transcript_37403/m.92517 type:complete len:311 (+) Transcript_37403:847-1779(+)
MAIMFALVVVDPRPAMPHTAAAVCITPSAVRACTASCASRDRWAAEHSASGTDTIIMRAPAQDLSRSLTSTEGGSWGPAAGAPLGPSTPASHATSSPSTAPSPTSSVRYRPHRVLSPPNCGPKSGSGCRHSSPMAAAATVRASPSRRALSCAGSPVGRSSALSASCVSDVAPSASTPSSMSSLQDSVSLAITAMMPAMAQGAPPMSPTASPALIEPVSAESLARLMPPPPGATDAAVMPHSARQDSSSRFTRNALSFFAPPGKPTTDALFAVVVTFVCFSGSGSAGSTGSPGSTESTGSKRSTGSTETTT